MVLCGTKMVLTSLSKSKSPFEAPLYLRVYGPLKKGGGYILKSYKSLTFPPIWWEYLQIKDQSVHFKPIFII